MLRNESIGYFTERELFTLGNMLLTQQQRQSVLSFLTESDRINRDVLDVPTDIVVSHDMLHKAIGILYNNGSIERTIYWYVIFRFAQSYDLYDDKEFTRFKKNIEKKNGIEKPFTISQMTQFSTTFLHNRIEQWSRFIKAERGKNIDCLELYYQLKDIIKHIKNDFL